MNGADGRPDHGDEPREQVGCDQHRAVTGDRAHRGEGVHRLCPRDPRDAVQGQGGNATFAQRPNHVVVDRGGGVEEADQRASAADHLGLVLAVMFDRLLHLQHHIGSCVHGPSVGSDLGPGGRVIRIRFENARAR